ncbi:MAG: oleate hydratase [Anaerolineales bacterium]
MTKRVVIIGGGIAGLSAAHFLQKHSREAENPLHLTILEASSQWGGKITTERVDGFVVEGGPDTFLRTKPWAVALCRELGLEDILTHGAHRAALLARKGAHGPRFLHTAPTIERRREPGRVRLAAAGASSVRKPD